MTKLSIGVSGIKPWGIRKVNIGKTLGRLTTDKIRIHLYFYQPKKYKLTLHCKTILCGDVPKPPRIIKAH